MTLSPDQISIFLQHAKEDRLYIAFLLAVVTGLRRGEVMGLRWQDIDFEFKTASIRKNLVLVNNKPVLQDPKTQGSKRSITLPDLAMMELKNHKRIQNQERL